MLPLAHILPPSHSEWARNVDLAKRLVRMYQACPHTEHPTNLSEGDLLGYAWVFLKSDIQRWKDRMKWVGRCQETGQDYLCMTYKHVDRGWFSTSSRLIERQLTPMAIPAADVIKKSYTIHVQVNNEDVQYGVVAYLLGKEYDTHSNSSGSPLSRATSSPPRDLQGSKSGIGFTGPGGRQLLC